MKLERVKRKEGTITKKQCVGCKYDKLENLLKADKDYCYLCDATGSERVEQKPF